MLPAPVAPHPVDVGVGGAAPGQFEGSCGHHARSHDASSAGKGLAKPLGTWLGRNRGLPLLWVPTSRAGCQCPGVGESPGDGGDSFGTGLAPRGRGAAQGLSPAEVAASPGDVERTPGMWGGHRGCGEGTGHGWGDPTGAVPGGAELRYPGKSPLRRHRPRHRYRHRPVPTAPPCPHLCGSIVAGSVGRSCRCLMPWWPPCAPGAARLGFRPPLRFRFPGGGGTERNGTGRRGEERREEERGGAGQHLAPAGVRGWGHRERGATGHGHRERPGEEEPGAAGTGSTGHGGPGTTWVWGSREHPWVRGAREHRELGAPGTGDPGGLGHGGVRHWGNTPCVSRWGAGPSPGRGELLRGREGTPRSRG